MKSALLIEQTARPHIVYVLLAINGFLIALMLALAKQVTGLGVPPIAYAFWQTAIAGSMLILFSLRQNIKINRKILVYCTVSGLSGIAIPNAIAFMLVSKIGTGFTGVMYALPPIFTLMIAVTIGMERLNFKRLLGILIAVSACAWLVLQRHQKLSGAELLWYALGLLIPIALSIGNIFRSLAWPKGIKSMPLAAMTLLTAASSLAVLAAVNEVTLLSSNYSATAIGLIAFQGVVTALTYLWSFELQKRSDPVFYSQLGAVAAVFGLMIGIVWFKESYSMQIWLGVFLIILGLKVSNHVSSFKSPRMLITERT